MTEPLYPIPQPDNTLVTLTDWVYGMALPLRAHTLALAIVRRVNWQTGKGCTASVETLADLSRLDAREVRRQLQWLVGQQIIGRKHRIGGTSETWLVMARQLAQDDKSNLDTERVKQGTGGLFEQGTGGLNNQSNLTNPPVTNPGLSSFSKEKDTPNPQPRTCREREKN